MIRILTVHDAADFVALRSAGLREAPLAFASSPEDPRAPDLAAARALLEEAPESVVLGGIEGARLVGLVGVRRDQHVKAGHKAHLWGMYVAPEARRRGVGRALLEAALAHAASLPGVELIHLGVTGAADAARALYTQAGFVAWGRESDALRFEDASTDQWHMVRRLGPGSGGDAGR